MQFRSRYLALFTTCVVAVVVAGVATYLTLGSHAANVGPSAGDVNNSGKVDVVDLSILLGNFGKAGTPVQGDTNGSGKVDVIDLSILLGNFGKSVDGTAPATLACSGTTRQLIWQTDYANASSLTTIGTSTHTPWYNRQFPNAPGFYGASQTDRMQLVKGSSIKGDATDPYRPTTGAMRVEVRPYDDQTNPTMPPAPAGKTYNTTHIPISEADGDVAPVKSSVDHDGSSRAEVYARQPNDAQNVDATLWPDPVGSTRWYGYAIYFPSDFAFDMSPSPNWLSITQLKGLNGGSPPVAVAVHNNKIILEVDNTGVLEYTITPGKWMYIDFGVHLSTSADGWVQLWVNNTKASPILDKGVARKTTGIATMDIVNGKTDGIYLKQGIYRTTDWDKTHIIYFGPVKIGTDCTDVLP